MRFLKIIHTNQTSPSQYLFVGLPIGPGKISYARATDSKLVWKIGSNDNMNNFNYNTKSPSIKHNQIIVTAILNVFE